MKCSPSLRPTWSWVISFIFIASLADDLTPIILRLVYTVPLPPFGQVQQTMPVLGFFSNDLQRLTFSFPGSCDYILACHLAL